jgi:hypothetical protein
LSCPAAASARTITARLPVDTLAFLQGTERAADWRLSDLGLPKACILISSRSARSDVTAAWLLLQTRKFPKVELQISSQPDGRSHCLRACGSFRTQDPTPRQL